MIRTLLIISGAAFVLALASIGGAMALGGRDLAAHGWTWVIRDDESGDSVRFERGTRDPGPDVTRTLAWTGGDALILSLAGQVDYVQGAEAGVTVTGPKAVVDRVRLENGELSLANGEEVVVMGWDANGPTGWAHSERLRITVTAPSVTRFDVRGSPDLTITGYDQPSLAVDVSGSGSVKATGRTDALMVDVNGSGEAELGGLTAKTAKVDVSGSGEADINAADLVEVDISGSGDVNLTQRPARLTQQISGSGEVSGA
jgi:hypothetical protein